MLLKMQMFLLRLFLIGVVGVRIASTKNVILSKEDLVTKLPLSDVQKEYIQDIICVTDFSYTEESHKKCLKSLNWYMDWDRSGLKMRCRMHDYLALEVPVHNRDQIVLIVPHPNDNFRHSIEPYIVPKHEKYAFLSPAEDREYTIYSSVLNEHGTPQLWHREGRLERWQEPEKRPYDIQVDVIINNSEMATSVVSWNHTGESDNCFYMNFKCSKRMKFWSKSIGPDAPNVVEFPNLPLNDTCVINLIGMHGIFQHSFDTFIPETSKLPQNMEAENLKMGNMLDDFHLYSVQDGDKWNVHVWWEEPSVKPERYNVTLIADDVTTLVVGGNATEAVFRRISGTDSYNVSITSIVGTNYTHFNKRAAFISHWISPRVWRWAGAAGGAWAAVVLLALIYYWRVRSCQPDLALDTKRKYQLSPLESKLAEATRLDPSRVEPCASDRWDVKIDDLLLHEVIGEGAFGVVRRGTMAAHGKEVAVKMLKDFPSLEEVRAFRVEMELMKSVGAHRHVVSLVGCCTARRPAIVAEYCSRGDLLNFLRCSWDAMVSKRKANYYNNNINTADPRNDLTKCKLTPETSRLVVNKIYDLQAAHETDLTPSDLLSFCRQIAMGMEFLALNKVVHRDLAARNVLVTADRTLKIADFGLSRDVYEENQYRQKGNGKMPVKWMALESLTRMIYTTQSDVWSFGVVMWEVVTVGCAPYSGIAAARLPRLLRAGYRMPRPPNCTHNLYQLMSSCWAARPRDRPTFAELHARLDELLKTASADDYLTLELDDEPPPTHKASRYLDIFSLAKRTFTRAGSYERPVQVSRNHYSSPPDASKNYRIESTDYKRIP